MTIATSRRGLFHTSALAGALALSIAGGAVAQERVYSIPAQSLAASLRDYGMASGEQIIFAETIVSGRQAPALQGAYASEEALRILLADSGLTADRVATGGIMIRRAGDPQSGSAAGDGADGTVDTLVVTAQKREEDIQDVPIAISAFTQETLERSQVAGGPDLMTQVPNMTFTKTNFSSYSIQIRGIGTQAISATTDAAVAVAFNNTPFIRNRFFEQEFYDLQRVEVLRGPQGTLYGRNATAGVVNIISAKPTFQYEAKLSGDVSNYNSTRVEGMVNVPLVDDKVAMRLAGAWTKRNGYVTNEITGNPIDGRDLWSTRLSLRFEPTDTISANLIWEHFEEDDDRLRSGKQLCHKDLKTEIGGVTVPPWGGLGTGADTYSQGCAPASLYAPDSFETPNGFSLPYYLPLQALGAPTKEGIDPYLSTTQSRDLRVIESTWDPEYRAKSDLVQLQLAYDMSDALTLASETAYSADTLWSLQDYNRFNTAPGAFAESETDRDPLDRVTGILNNGVFCDPQLGCSNRLVAVDLSTAKSRQFSQELRLSSNFSGPFNFSLGSNFLRYDTEDKYYVFINTLTLVAGYPALDGSSDFPPWIPNVSDNSGCLVHGGGMIPGDPGKPQGVTGCIYIDPNPIGSLNDEGHNYFLSRNPYKLISYALFGEAYYNITDDLKVTAGLRWTVDKKEAPQLPSWLLAAGSAGYPVAETVSQEWREPTGRLVVDWKPDLSFTDETLLYASYAHGYKAGGANPPRAMITVYRIEGLANLIKSSLAHPKTFDPEFVNAFEFGAKNTLLDGALTLNANGFYYDYTGYQISQIVDRSAVNLNFDAEVWGAELEVDWRPLENLRFGFKGGYEKTRVADGESAIDLMDRTAGHSDWIVAKPFPTIPSNCIVPVWLATFGNRINVPGGGSGPNPGPCLLGYIVGRDPVTGLPYTPNPTEFEPGVTPSDWSGYPGFDPLSAPNNGEGFTTDLSGNELPNAPHFTATVTADYTVPLPSDWLMTLHTDLYYQSEAWTRIFNMDGYDKLKAYTNVNLAAIFTNEPGGWKVMAYVKNVFDRDSITGAFLNSDDTGLTTNVFLTEPRLYGLRVTKEWNGGPWSTGANPNHPAGERYPLTVELSGQVQHHTAPYETLTPSFTPEFPEEIALLGAQNQNLDWGDGRAVKLTYSPNGSPWAITLAARYGKTNHTGKSLREADETLCLSGPEYCDITSPSYSPTFTAHAHNYSKEVASQKEEHAVVDFAVGRDFGLGASRLKGSIAAGLRYAELDSDTNTIIRGVPDRDLPDDFFPLAPFPEHHYQAALGADRSFKGTGPILSWNSAATLAELNGLGQLDLDWTISGGVLFGKQRAAIVRSETVQYFNDKYFINPLFPTPVYEIPTSYFRERHSSVTAPLIDISVGLSYSVGRVKVGAGYRWERYFDVLDVGHDEEQSGDRTIDGPYFKLSVGFGG